MFASRGSNAVQLVSIKKRPVCLSVAWILNVRRPTFFFSDPRLFGSRCSLGHRANHSSRGVSSATHKTIRKAFPPFSSRRRQRDPHNLTHFSRRLMRHTLTEGWERKQKRKTDNVTSMCKAEKEYKRNTTKKSEMLECEDELEESVY